MKRLKIEKIENYEYLLEDEDKKSYSLNLEFFDLEENIKNGDYIHIDEKLLDKNYDGYSYSYAFGSLDSKYGKNNISLNDTDVIKLETQKKEIYLKRLYG